ncbi:MAG: methyltransferase domain-containing protein [Bacteroidota bacterium]|nr:methyltransferase domain-containing protein [Bacteroidota bacterium]
MKLYEWAYFNFFKPGTLYLYTLVYDLIKKEIKGRKNLELLDIGGRKSPYTIGLDVNITLSDIPNNTDTQQNLNLGINDSIIENLKSKRSNIKDLIYDDMTVTKIAENSFDIASAIEVLEHAPDDENFVKNVAKILKKDGVFIMTTPNGDYKPIPHNEDHIRHYKLEQLKSLLQKHFREVEVFYAIKSSNARSKGLKPMPLTKPMQFLETYRANMTSHKESADPKVKTTSMKTNHLVAIARK